jgi:hypothetical protein
VFILLIHEKVAYDMSEEDRDIVITDVLNLLKESNKDRLDDVLFPPHHPAVKASLQTFLTAC